MTWHAIADGVASGIRYSVRRPGATVLSSVAIACGMGMASGVSTAVDAARERVVPSSAAVVLRMVAMDEHSTRRFVSPALFRALQDTFAPGAIAAYSSRRAVLEHDGHLVDIALLESSASLVEVLGAVASPAVVDSLAGGSTALLSANMMNRLGIGGSDDPATVRINGQAFMARQSLSLPGTAFAHDAWVTIGSLGNDADNAAYLALAARPGDAVPAQAVETTLAGATGGTKWAAVPLWVDALGASARPLLLAESVARLMMIATCLLGWDSAPSLSSRVVTGLA